MKRKWVSALKSVSLVVVLLSLLLSSWPSAVMAQSTLPSPLLSEDDMALAKTAGASFIKTAVEFHPEWEDALLVEGKHLYDIEGQVIAYLFTLEKNEQAIGRIVVGSSAYNYDVLEAGTSLPPKLPDKQKVPNVPSSELESTEPKLTYLGYDKFLAIYTTDQERIVLDLQTGEITKTTEIQSQMISPEEYQKQQEERLRELTTKGVEGLVLSGVPNRQQMSDTDCGPTAAANIVGYYKANGYPNFDSWPTDHDHLYNYMHTDAWGGPGTAPWNAGPGFDDYASSKGYNGFWSNYYIAYSELYGSIRGSLYSEWPLLIMFGWGGSYAEWHYCTISGFLELGQGNGRYIYIKNPGNTTEYVNYDTEIGVSTIHFIFPG